jgi:phage shock protein PspC (stress-responsive transcriptional regulator)
MDSNTRLTRDPQRAILGGVCAGIANRLDADLNLVRLLTIGLAVITGGVGILVYAALWLIMPLPDASPGLPSRDAITDELRVAADRAREAADIIARAARQAASEISEVGSQRSSTPTADAAPAADSPPPTPPAPPVPPVPPTPPAPPSGDEEPPRP